MSDLAIGNRGTNTHERVTAPTFPDADSAVRGGAGQRPEGAVDILLVNPPAPDGGIWIRCQHRVGRRSREGMVWAQVSLAQLAALFPDYRVAVVDAIATRMGWKEFERLLREKQPHYYVTHVTGPTLQNDMYGCFLARSMGAVTVAFGTHVTPMPVETMAQFPALDYVLRGEPELTLRELVDVLEASRDQESEIRNQKSENRNQKTEIRKQKPEGREQKPEGGRDPWKRLDEAFRQRLWKMFTEANPGWSPAWQSPAAPRDDSSSDPRPPAPALRIPTAGDRRLETGDLGSVRGLVWRNDGAVTINADRGLIRHLDDLPLPRHDLLPLKSYVAPLVGGPYSFIVTSRGCPAGCRFCIKHVNYGDAVRFRSPENVLAEIEMLIGLGVTDIHMYADLFTLNREHVLGICRGIKERGWKIRWTANSRVDFVDQEMLQEMAGAGCWLISWGIESANEQLLKRVHKGYPIDQPMRALQWAREAGIKNWGYFIVGLPGETEETIKQTIALAKKLPLELALFHIAAPHPGTPFFFEIVEQGWFRPGTRWEQVDMDRCTVIDYPDLPAERLEAWARRAFRSWAFRPGPAWTFIKMLLGSPRLWPVAAKVGLESLGWGLKG